MWVFAHLLSLAHGLAAALASISVFYVIGLLLLPRRWHTLLDWPTNIVVGLALYVLLCSLATGARHIPVIYVVLVFGAGLWILTAVRFRLLQSILGPLRRNRPLQAWLAGFSVLYAFAYLLVRPPAGGAVLPLPREGALDLVGYATHARELLIFGRTITDTGAADYLSGPAGAYLLAWHSLFFLGDPLHAAMPLLFMIAAFFGALALELARSVFGLSWRGAMTIAAIAVCAPLFRWVLVTYPLSAMLSAASVFYLGGVLGRVALNRTIDTSFLLSTAAGVILLFLSAWPTVGSVADIAQGVVEVGRHLSPVAVFGFPSRIPSAAEAPGVLECAALLVLPLVPMTWAAAASALRRSPAIGRIGSAVDRELARALVTYVAVAVIAGNVAVQAVEAPASLYWPGAWRELNQLGRLPYQSFTLKVADEPNGLSTALARYYMPGRQVNVIGRGVSNDDLPFEDVSRQQPMFIQNFGCEGVGHGDAVAAPGVGCLLMAPPSMTAGTSYPFNRTFLFMNFDHMTAREAGGRWNTEPTLNLQFTADPQRAPLDREMYLNFFVNSFRPEGAPPLRLVSRWGQNRRGEVIISGQQWFSLPVGSRDWTRNRLWTLPVAIEFPDGRTILFHEVALTESPRGQAAAIHPEP